jgi:hypothetical protein
MSRESGFLQLRRGLWEHVRDGRMSTTEALAFIFICSEADTRTGIWKGCAKSLSGELGIPERTARDVLEKMERGDYIRRFAVPGRHACYPILVHKFLITQGEHNGEQLNAREELRIEKKDRRRKQIIRKTMMLAGPLLPCERKQKQNSYRNTRKRLPS